MLSPTSRRQNNLTRNDGAKCNSPKAPHDAVKKRQPLSWLWGSPSRKSVTVPSKLPPTNDCTSQQKRSPLRTHVHNLTFSTTSLTSPPSQKTEPQTLMHPFSSPRRIHLDPRVSNRSRQPRSNLRSGRAGASLSSHTEEPQDKLKHREHHHLTAGSASSNDSSSITMTPTVMFSEEVDHQQIQLSTKRRDQQYHHSPHWTGKVRVNPFSPLPPQYLDPPSSTKSLPDTSNYVGFPVLGDKNTSPSHPSKRIGMRRSCRLKPKASCFAPMKDNTSPTDVTEGPFEISSATDTKRKSEVLVGLPPSTNDDVGPLHKQMKLNPSRYLEDFEEIRHLGSGSFGSVNACLSRLDGCMYAIKSLNPQGIERSNLGGHSSFKSQSDGLYGKRQQSSFDYPPVPPTPRRNVLRSPAKKRPAQSNTNDGRSVDMMDGGLASGAKHWTESALSRMLREVHALAALCNEADVRTFHIVRYHQAWFECDGTLYIQTELCSNTLRHEIDKNFDSARNKLNVAHAPKHLRCLREILLALQLIHSKGMVHLDIKPDNIFVQNGLYKLGDFGLAGIASSMDVEEGDSRYMSRDMLQGGQRDLTKCDIFSLGATMYELCLGQTLPSCGDEWHLIRNGKLTPFWPPNLYQIIKEMMHPDPAMRPSASDLLSRDELNCKGEGVDENRKSNSYNICLKESTPLLKKSTSWTS